MTSGGYWTTGNDGTVTKFTGEGTPANNFIHYDATNNVLTLHNAAIKKGLDYSESIQGGTYIHGSAIGVFHQNGATELTIQLEGTNTIAEVSAGIYVLASSVSDSNASLTITGSGSLDASGSQTGIGVVSNGGDATLIINSAEVKAVGGTYTSCSGIWVQAQNGSDVSLTVDGGSLTASGDTGICLLFGSSESGSGTPRLAVSGNAIVRANSGISDNSSADIQIGADSSGNTGGIVFDGGEGTVYGSVTLQEDLEIGEGESLTIPNGSSLTIPNDKTLTVNGGELTGNVPQSGVVYKVTEVTLDKSNLTLDVGESETLTVTITPDNATDKSVTWESSAPGVATVDTSGKVTAVAQGTATITATAADGGKTATCKVTVEHDPASEWSSDANGHWHECEACGDKLDYAAHTTKVEGRQDATCTEDGYTGDTVCSVCGYVIAKGKAIPTTGHDFVDGVCTLCGEEEPAKNEGSIPATGDVAPMVCALAGIFGIMLVAAGLRKRVSR